MRTTTKIMIAMAAALLLGLPLLIYVIILLTPGEANAVLQRHAPLPKVIKVDGMIRLKILKGPEGSQGVDLTCYYDSRATGLTDTTAGDTLTIAIDSSGGYRAVAEVELTLPPTCDAIDVRQTVRGLASTIEAVGLDMEDMRLATCGDVKVVSCQVDTLTVGYYGYMPGSDSVETRPKVDSVILDNSRIKWLRVKNGVMHEVRATRPGGRPIMVWDSYVGLFTPVVEDF